jgi:hypothetical protein
MSEKTRQRRLHVECRLEELRSKYGRGIEALEEWGEAWWNGLQAPPVEPEPQPKAQPHKVLPPPPPMTVPVVNVDDLEV